MKIFKIWNIESRRENMLVMSEDIKQVADLSGCLYFNTHLNPETVNIDELNTKLAESNLEITYAEELQEFFDCIGIDANVSGCKDYEEIDNVIVWEENTNQFFNLADFDSYSCCEWWDGNNWVQDILFDGCDETEVVTEDEPTSIDEWDGHNFVTGGVGLHEQFYKAISVEGDAVENTYVLYKYNQWQGSYSQGEIMDIEELKAHLADLDREPENILPKN